MKESYDDRVFCNKKVSIICYSTPEDWNNHCLIRWGFQIGEPGEPDYRVSTPENPFPELTLDELNAFILLLRGIAYLMHKQYCPGGHQLLEGLDENKVQKNE